ncbi:hypothetical protein OXX79_003864 [Metschnikowia pulcherrima]
MNFLVLLLSAQAVFCTPIPANLKLKASEPRSLSMRPIDPLATREAHYLGSGNVVDHISFDSVERRAEPIDVLEYKMGTPKLY